MSQLWALSSMFNCFCLSFNLLIFHINLIIITLACTVSSIICELTKILVNELMILFRYFQHVMISSQLLEDQYIKYVNDTCLIFFFQFVYINIEFYKLYINEFQLKRKNKNLMIKLVRH